MLCDRSRCRATFRASPASFWGGRYPRPISVKRTPNSTKSTPKSALLDDRPWQVVAGPPLSRINRIVPLESKIAKEQKQLGAEVDEHLRAARIAAETVKAAPPVTVGAGAGARPDLAVPDDLAIPFFLKREFPCGRDPAGKRPSPCDGPGRSSRSLGALP